MFSSLVFTGPWLQIWTLERAAWGQRGPYARLGQCAINTEYAVSTIIIIIIMNSCPRSGYGAVLLLHGWYHVKLLPTQRMLCVYHTTMDQFTVTLFGATYVGCVFSCDLPLALDLLILFNH